MSVEVTYLEVWFEGHVQGVGFRFKTREISKEFEVNGQVQNLNDGRVYLQIEGSGSETEAFKAEIESQMQNFIRNVESQSIQRTAQFKGFVIA